MLEEPDAWKFLGDQRCKSKHGTTLRPLSSAPSSCERSVCVCGATQQWCPGRLVRIAFYEVSSVFECEELGFQRNPMHGLVAVGKNTSPGYDFRKGLRVHYARPDFVLKRSLLWPKRPCAPIFGCARGRMIFFLLCPPHCMMFGPQL